MAFRPVASTLARVVLYGGGVLASLISGLLIARYLDPHGYAFYRVACLRAPGYVAPLLGVVSWWAYRYAGMGERDAVSTAVAGVLVLALSSSIAAVLATYVTGFPDPLWPMLAAVYGYLAGVFSVVGAVSNAVRPARAGLVTAVRRWFYTLLVAVSLLGLRAGVNGVLVSAAISFTAGIALYVLSLKPWITEGRVRLSLLLEWFRGSWVPVVTGVATMVAGLDALALTLLWGGRDVAAFLAATLPAALLGEILGYSFSHLQAYVLGGGVYERVFAAARVGAVLLLPLLAYMLVWPEPIVSLVNPTYVYMSRALVYASLTTMVLAVSSPGWQLYLGMDRSRTLSVGRGLKLYTLTVTVNSLLYLALTLTLPRLLGSLSDGWGLAMVARQALYAAAVAVFLDPSARRLYMSYGLRLALYAAALATLAYLLPAPVEHRFTSQLLALVKPFTIYAAIAYALLLAMDSEARRVAVTVVKLAQAGTGLRRAR